jgi:hypothetical protein
MIFVGSGSLSYALSEYAEHYNRERPHQGIENRMIAPLELGDEIGDVDPAPHAVPGRGDLERWSSASFISSS